MKLNLTVAEKAELNELALIKRRLHEIQIHCMSCTKASTQITRSVDPRYRPI